MSETPDEARSDERANQEPHGGSHESQDQGQGRVKVTDKRMFRPDGELREEYSFLDQKTKSSQDSSAVSQEQPAEKAVEIPAKKPSPDTAAQAAASGRPDAGAPKAAPAAGGGPRHVPGYDAAPEKVSFLNLLSVLAEPVAIYLGDVQLPDGRSAENLEMARLHIDLLEVLRDRTRGNRSADETAILDDLLYRLRMRYVQKSGS